MKFKIEIIPQLVFVGVLVYIVAGNIIREAALRKAIRRSKKWEREQDKRRGS